MKILRGIIVGVITFSLGMIYMAIFNPLNSEILLGGAFLSAVIGVGAALDIDDKGGDGK